MKSDPQPLLPATLLVLALATFTLTSLQAGPLEDALDGGVGTYSTPNASDAAWTTSFGSAESGFVNPGQSSEISVDVTGPGIVSFYWRINASPLGMPPNEVTAFSGIDFDAIGPIASFFAPESLRVAPGSQTVRWTYFQRQSFLGPYDESARLDFVFYYPQQKSVASDAGTNRQFGSAAAIAGNLAVVGAGTAPGAAPSSGAAYLIDVSDMSNPVERAKLTAEDGETDDFFGRSVALCGDLILIGASGGESAYLFDAGNPDSPMQLSRLTVADGSGFGTSVALCGNLAVVGSPYEDGGRGAAYVFDVSDPADPRLVSRLSAGDGNISDTFGISVAVSGTTVLIGSPQHNVGADPDAGSAYLFSLADPSRPLETAKLTASVPMEDETFGSSVALEGERALVGAEAGMGAAYLFDISDPANPAERARIVDSDPETGDLFGARVSLSGDVALIASPGDDPTLVTEPDAGSVHLFDISDPAAPVERAEFTAHDLGDGDFYGFAAGVWGSRAVIGAPGQSTRTGGAYFPSLASHASDISEALPIRKTIGPEGGSYPIRVNAIGAWNAQSNAGFAVLDETSGSRNGSVLVTVSKNRATSPRQATITVAGVPHLLTQEAGPVPPRIVGPKRVTTGGRAARVSLRVRAGLPVTMRVRASGGARARVRGNNPYRITVKKIGRRVTRVRAIAKDTENRSARSTIRVIRR